MANIVTAKGQVTIPKEVRDLLGLRPGSKVEFRRAADGSVVLSNAVDKALSGQPAISRFERFRGQAGEGPDTDSVMALTRGEP